MAGWDDAVQRRIGGNREFSILSINQPLTIDFEPREKVKVSLGVNLNLDIKGKAVYNEKVMPDFDRFMRGAFADVCREYLDLMSKYRKLGKGYNEWSYWYGKNGILDVIGQDPDKNVLVATCVYSEKKTGVDQIDNMKRLVDDAGLKPAKMCIFSKRLES